MATGRSGREAGVKLSLQEGQLVGHFSHSVHAVTGCLRKTAIREGSGAFDLIHVRWTL